MNFVYFDNIHQDFKFLQGDGCLHINDNNAYVKPTQIVKQEVYTPDQDIRFAGEYVLKAGTQSSDWSIYKVNGYIQLSVFTLIKFQDREWNVTLDIDGVRQTFGVNRINPYIIIPIICVRPKVIKIITSIPCYFKKGLTMYNVTLTSC